MLSGMRAIGHAPCVGILLIGSLEPRLSAYSIEQSRNPEAIPAGAMQRSQSVELFVHDNLEHHLLTEMLLIVVCLSRLQENSLLSLVPVALVFLRRL